MTDYFALLGQPRSPWLESESVQAAFLQHSSAAHPDRVHHAGAAEKAVAADRFATLNAACVCLREPTQRLLHLLTLERGAAPADVTRIPSGTMDLFMQVADLCRHADVFLDQRAGETSPLLQVRLFEEAMGWTERLEIMHRQVGERREALLEQVRALNARWPRSPENRPEPALLDELEALHRVLSYVTRWSAQLQDRRTRLMLPC